MYFSERTRAFSWGRRFITSAAFAATGSLGYALLYPIVVPAVCFVLCLFLMPETKQISIWKEEYARA